MNITLIDDAGKLWHQLWSVRLAAGSAVFGAAAAALPFVAPAHSSLRFAALTFVVTLASPLLALAAGFARVVKQPAVVDALAAAHAADH